MPVSTIAYGTACRRHRDRRAAPSRCPSTRRRSPTLADTTGGQAYTAATGDELTAVYEDIGSSIGWRTEPRELTPYLAALALLLMTVGGVDVAALVRPAALTRGRRHDRADATHLARPRPAGRPRLREPGRRPGAAGPGPGAVAPGVPARGARRPARAPAASASRLWPPPPRRRDPTRPGALGAGPAPRPRPLPRAGRRRLGRPRGRRCGALGLPRGGTGAAGRDPAPPAAPSVRRPPPPAPRPRQRPPSCRAWSRCGPGRLAGSGFVLDDRGHVITNHHVVEGEHERAAAAGRRAQPLGGGRRQPGGRRHRGAAGGGPLGPRPRRARELGRPRRSASPSSRSAHRSASRAR